MDHLLQGPDQDQNRDQDQEIKNHPLHKKENRQAQIQNVKTATKRAVLLRKRK